MTLDSVFEDRRILRIGQIEVICGPMFSGKTEELIRRLKRAQIAKQNVVVFKPPIDDRYSENHVVSHSQQKIPCIGAKDAKAMRGFLIDQPKSFAVVGIDEVQFYDQSVVSFVDELVAAGTRVIIAGLDKDSWGNPFGSMPQLLAIADLVSKQYAICVNCGMPATMSQRVIRQKEPPSDEKSAKINDQVFVGMTNSYEARCRRCFSKEILTIA